VSIVGFNPKVFGFKEVINDFEKNIDPVLVSFHVNKSDP
jgi:hypothetical protein